MAELRRIRTIADLDQAMSDVSADLAETLDSVRAALGDGDDPGRIWATLLKQMQDQPDHLCLALGALAILRLAQHRAATETGADQ